LTLSALQANKCCVLDADALTSFRAKPEDLFELLRSVKRCAILTPHNGEFNSLFASLDYENYPCRLSKAKAAASLCASVIVFKGPDTIIAAPDGRVCINDNAPAWLATAGSGDVLAGVIGAMRAQGMSAFDAACAGVWLHADAASRLQYPMTAEQLCGLIGQSVGEQLN